MSTDGDNIVRGRIRRWAAVHGRTFNPCEPKKGGLMLPICEMVKCDGKDCNIPAPIDQNCPKIKGHLEPKK